jgi:hypothetical protein
VDAGQGGKLGAACNTVVFLDEDADGAGDDFVVYYGLLLGTQRSQTLHQNRCSYDTILRFSGGWKRRIRSGRLRKPLGSRSGISWRSSWVDDVNVVGAGMFEVYFEGDILAATSSRALIPLPIPPLFRSRLCISTRP